MPKSMARSVKIIGCKVCTPLACAIAPTAKGNLQQKCYEKFQHHGTRDEPGRCDKRSWTYTAAPPPPTAELKPIAATCRFEGNSFVAAIMVDGNKGPMKNPTSAIATAETMN